ncbi:MAG: plasmid mobilization relaxosome protein MobC [Ruminococcus sp.]|nr:plasmid mobilization relaxosome protein MobC [Ruminococcus sp.]
MKRTRSHQVSFRLNDKEYALLQRKLAASGLSLTEFFIETISKGKVIVINDFIPLLSELKRQGVNLNQLTRRINQFSPISEREIMTTLLQCQNTYRRLYELSEQLGA